MFGAFDPAKGGQEVIEGVLNNISAEEDRKCQFGESSAQSQVKII